MGPSWFFRTDAVPITACLRALMRSVSPAGVQSGRALGLWFVVSGMSAQSGSVHRGVCTEQAWGKTAQAAEHEAARASEQKFTSLLRLQWIISELACYTYSMVVVPLYDTLGPDAIRYIINTGEASSGRLSTLKTKIPKGFSAVMP